jgi:serine/threonine protein kinase/tetratricopeptide (TPR) repeat protein
MRTDSVAAYTSANDGRYQFERRLGEGASGAVYLVRDRETGEQLALKRLHKADERSITRLKREFRALANINHRNVIRLYELARSPDGWFFTMEYVEGDDIVSHLGLGADVTAALRRTAEKLVTDGDQVGRVVTTFHQLASGVHALHRAGVLHRDLKPSNVLVAKQRVVVLDFGIALELGEGAATITIDGVVSGTPAYMAPEQLRGRDWGEPNDWYAFGVMLYEALSGELPIEGRLQELLRKKLESDPMPIGRIVSGLPSALEKLCMQLLAREPEQRPSGEEVLSVLHSCTPASPVPVPQQLEAAELMRLRQRAPHRAIFGRADERNQLRTMRERVESEGSATVLVSGPSGSGKTVLVESFLEEIEQEPQRRGAHAPLILRARCYERETVRFKALDAAIDALVTQLSREDDLEVSHVLPREIGVLAQLFPSLGRLPAAQKLLEPMQRPVAAPHAREEAEAALREMFLRLGRRRMVVLWVDDLHWGDLDSARILRTWIEHGLRGVMLVLSFRSDEVSTSPCLRLVLGAKRAGDAGAAIDLGALGPSDIRALCGQIFAGAAATPEALSEITEHIVIESEGSPFLAAQLAELALSELDHATHDTRETLTVDTLVSRRTSLLSEGARELLNVLAVAIRPLPVRLARQLTAAEYDARAALHELSGFGLVRTQEGEGERLVTTYHDRLREALLRALDPDVRTELDRRLLRALEAEEGVDQAWLHALAWSIGERETALRHGLAAAEAAMLALAFEQAAELYGACLKLAADPGPQAAELWQKLAIAQAHAGHGQKAASAYREAARRSAGTRALQLERSAASHLLRSGHFEEGEALIAKVLSELHLDVPQSQPALLAAIAWERARLALRGLDFTPRSMEGIPTEVRYGGELYATLSIEIQPYDPLRAALFQARSLRMALEWGVPQLIARVLCVAATMAAVSGGAKAHARAKHMLDRAAELERAEPSTIVQGNICSARAVVAALRADMRETLVQSAEAERIYRQLVTFDEGEYYHRFTVLAARIAALVQEGMHEQAEIELTRTENEARATENISALLLLSGARTRMDVMKDQPEQSMARLELERTQLPKHRFGLMHSYYLLSVMRIGCATGDVEWALRHMSEEWEAFQQSLLGRSSYMSVMWPGMHARMLLNRAVSRKESVAQATRAISADLRTLEHAGVRGARPSAERLRARLAFLAGDRAKAAKLYRASSLEFLHQDRLPEEAARHDYVAELIAPGADSASIKATALETLRSFGYVNPLNDIAGYFPELVTRAPSRS